MLDEQKQDQFDGNGESNGRARADRTLVWIVVAVMTVICAAVGVLSAVLTGHFMRRGQTLPAITVGENIQQNIAAVVATRKPAVAEISCGGLRGSGIAMKRENGKVYVLTNAHVLETSKSPSVRFDGDDSYYAGEVLGYNTFYDVAVITVVHDDVYVLSEEYISPTTVYNEGDYVVAIGNAMGMGIASYDGIISRSSEVLTYNLKQVPVMRTTAAINAGMSGGALFDMSGNLIGLDTYRMSSSKQKDIAETDDGNHNASYDVEDTGFVVPISIVYPVYKQILNYNVDGGEVGLINMQYFPTTNTSSIGGIIFVDLGFTCEYRGGKLTVTSIDSDNAYNGISVGDVIVAVGEYEITSDLCRTAGEFLRYRKYAYTGANLRLTVSNGDKTFSAEYKDLHRYVS
ncbi:MAG: trypsin-like peptidase domain-containing protein [Clostridiales bacterium]|nr:trypsin-like peptidase domain-containing protein [Clostridiales bacterium]